jgi:hypothetical protein
MNDYVYFIQEGDAGNVKIGRAIDPVGRMATLQTGNPNHLTLIATIKGGDKERALHAKFKRYHINGEWFAGDAVRAWIAETPKKQKPRPRLNNPTPARLAKGIALILCVIIILVCIPLIVTS